LKTFREDSSGGVIRKPEDELEITLESNGKGFRRTRCVRRNPVFFARIPAVGPGNNATWTLGNLLTLNEEDGNEEENHKKSNRTQEELHHNWNRTLPLHPDQGEIK